MIKRRIFILLTLVTGLLSFAAGANAAAITSVSLAWNPSPSQNVAGYEIVYGTSSGNYSTAVPVSNTTTNVAIRGLVSGTTYYFAAASYNSSGNTSGYSPEVSGVAGATNSSGSSGTSTNVPALLTPVAATSKAAGQFAFSVAGQAGSQYIVQASTDLVHWVTLQTNTSPFSFVDSNASQFHQRFYRTGYIP